MLIFPEINRLFQSCFSGPGYANNKKTYIFVLSAECKTNQIRMKPILIIFFFVPLLIISCEKDKAGLDEHHHEEDTTFPVVNLTSPSDSTIYNSGDTVFITGYVTDEDLHEGEITIIDDTSAFLYFTENPYVHGQDTAQINYFYVVNVTQNRVVTLTVSYEDHTPHVSTVTRKLFFQP